jgi:hypothetical protein
MGEHQIGPQSIHLVAGGMNLGQLLRVMNPWPTMPASMSCVRGSLAGGIRSRQPNQALNSRLPIHVPAADFFVRKRRERASIQFCERWSATLRLRDQ